MQKITFLLFILLLINGYAFSQYQWPLKNSLKGENILYQPQDKIGNELNFGNLVIGANEGDVVVASESGTIDYITYVYHKQLNYVIVDPKLYTKEAINKGFDKKQREFLAKEANCNPKYVSLYIKVKTGNQYYTITGLRPFRYLKTGSTINKGDTIGKVGFVYQKIKEPAVMFNVMQNSTVSDPMGVFGLPSTFTPPVCKFRQKDNLTHLYSPQELKTDFKIFIASLQEGHPGLYDYINKQELDSLIDEIKGQLVKPMTAEEFRLLLAEVITQIRDSHTAILPVNYKPLGNIKPPVLFGLKNDSLLVYSCTPEYKKFLGKKISYIDHMNVKEMTEKIKAIMYSRDGYIESVLEKELFIHFWKYYSLIAFKRNNDTTKLLFSDGLPLTFVHKDYDKNSYIPQFNINNKRNKHIDFKRLTNKIGYIHIHEFLLNDVERNNLQEFIRNISDSLYQGLIIDVRNNPGGDEHILNEIYSYIAQEKWKSAMQYKVNKKGSFQLFEYSTNYAPESELFYNYIPLESSNSYIFPEDSIQWNYPNDSIHFKGKLVILANESSLSAASSFPAMVHKQKRGLMIGRETGSCYYHMNGIEFPKVRLKNTELELFMPLVQVTFDKKENSIIPQGHGVIPDILIPLTYSEFNGSNDQYIQSAINELRKQTGKNNPNKKWFILVSFLVGIISLFFIFRKLIK